MDKEPITFWDILQKRTEENPSSTAIRFIQDDKSVLELTNKELNEKAKSMAANMLKKVIPGERVVIVMKPGIEFIVSYFACLCANVIAVPTYPLINQKSIDKLTYIIKDCSPKIILFDEFCYKKFFLLKLLIFFPFLTRFFNFVLNSSSRKALKSALSYKKIQYAALNKGKPVDIKKPQFKPDDVAFIQYTSGSTSLPKGVRVLHRNLMAQMETIRQTFQLNKSDIHVSWLPPYHDLGLIGSILSPVYVGFSVTLMSPFQFLKAPIEWLKLVSQQKATIITGPNFSYDLLLKRERSMKVKPDLDLSSLRIMALGSDFVNHQTVKNLNEVFSKYGLKKSSLRNSYGLAEATLVVALKQLNLDSDILYLDRTDIANNKVFVHDDINENTYPVVCSGITAFGQFITIVNPETRQECHTSEIGEIWVSGPSVTDGYWNKPEETLAVFNATLDKYPREKFLRTGDLGFIKNNDLYMTGRKKELILINGLKYYPHDIELVVSHSHNKIIPHGTIAFAHNEADREYLGLICETAESSDSILYEIIICIQDSVASYFQLKVHEIALVKPRSLSKTTSGKIQRVESRKLLLTDNDALLKRWKVN